MSEPEQTLLCRLSVFAGGWHLDAAEAVCGGGDVEVYEVIDLLTSLVDRSLVQAEPTDTVTRYWLLETIRQYGTEHLGELRDDEVYATRDRHAAWFLSLAEQAAPEIYGADQERCLEALEAEHDNFDAAMVHLTANPETVTEALHLGIALCSYWLLRHRSHGAAIMQAALATSVERQPPPLRAAALYAVVRLHQSFGDPHKTRACIDEGLAIARPIGDPVLLSEFLSSDSFAKYKQGDHDGARTSADQALALARQTGDMRVVADALRVSALIRGPRPRRSRAKSGRERSWKRRSDTTKRCTTVTRLQWITATSAI